MVDLLEAVLGAGNVRVTVSALLDFSRAKQTSEQFSPVDARRPLIRNRSSVTTRTENSPANALLPSCRGSSSPQVATGNEAAVNCGDIAPNTSPTRPRGVSGPIQVA